MSADADALLGALYEGPLEDPPWGAFLDLLRARFAALTATLIVHAPADPSLGLVLSRGVRRFESAYRERYFGSDPFVNLREGEVFTLSDVLGPEALRASEFYRRFLEPAGVLNVMGVDLHADALDARLRLTRGPDAPDFSPAERRAFAALAPHARRVLRLYARITRAESERDAYAGTVDQLAVGTLLLDERGRVLSQNAASLRLARAGAGLAVREERPVAARTDDTRRLREAIERALAARQRGEPSAVEALRIAGAGGEDFGVLVRPYSHEPGAEGRTRPALALLVGDPGARDEISLDALRTLFGLTPAEANVAARLAGGATLDEAAEALDMARNTARAHLRAIFEKTGVARQADLVRLILRSVATLS